MVAFLLACAVSIESFGAVGNDDGSGGVGIDCTQAIQAALDSGDGQIVSAGNGSRYRITKTIDIPDGVTIDFGGDWIEADPAIFQGNALFRCRRSADGIRIKDLQLDGNWDYDKYLREIESNINDSTAANEVSRVKDRSFTSFRLRYNGLELSPGNEATARCVLIDNLRVRNVCKSCLGVTNPVGLHARTLRFERYGAHGVVLDWSFISPNQEFGSARIDSLYCEQGDTAFDFSTSVREYKSRFDRSPPVVGIGLVHASEIAGRTKVHGPWDVNISAASFASPKRFNSYPAIDSPAMSARFLRVGSLSVDGYSAAIHASHADTSIDTLYVNNLKLQRGGLRPVAIAGYAPIRIGLARMVNVSTIIYGGGDLTIGDLYAEMTKDGDEYWTPGAAYYPLQVYGATRIEKAHFRNYGIGRTPASYLMYSGGDLSIGNFSTSQDDGVPPIRNVAYVKAGTRFKLGEENAK